MKLFDKQDVHFKVRHENDQLLQVNARLRKVHADLLMRLNNAKANYDPEKILAMKEYEAYVQDFNDKKAKLGAELMEIDIEIKKKKDILYGFVEKQDILEERIHQADKREKLLDAREAFVEELERKINEKNHV